MNAEQRWENQEEWKNDSGGMEIKSVKKYPSNSGLCDSSDCIKDACLVYVIGEISKRGGSAEVYVCKEHADDDLVWEIYEGRN